MPFFAPLQGLTAGPFFSTPEQRLALARERFFGEGQRPTGLLPEPVLQSWLRCQAAGLRPHVWPGPAPVSALRLDSARRQARALRQAARQPMHDLGQALQASAVQIALIDGKGLVLDAPEPPACGMARGTDWSETAMGSNAVALVLATGRAAQLRGGEHFFEALSTQQAAAAPVLNAQGHLEGVLLLRATQTGFGFDPVAVASQYASAIENRLLRQQAGVAWLLEFQTSPELLGTPLAALLGIDAGGRVVWLNGVARRLSGFDDGRPMPAAQDLLGLDLPTLASRLRQPAACPLGLGNGLTVWLRNAAPVPETSDPATDPASDPPEEAARPAGPADEAGRPPSEAPFGARLEDVSRALIDRTLATCGGNVSQAAKRLGISRGRIYRHLQAQGRVGNHGCAERDPT